jgi:protein transport protein SEC9
VKKDTISSTQNAIRIAAQAESTGVDILERLGVQKEKLLDTEENLEEADIQIQVAGEKVRKIKRLNRSLWGIIRNPFAMIRRARRIQRIEERRAQLAEAKRERREGTNIPQMDHQTPQMESGNDSNKDEPTSAIVPQQQNTKRMRYQFEADSEDEAMEDEIEENIEHLYGATIRLKNVGLAISQELDAQSTLVKRIVVKVDRNEDEVALNSHRQDRLRRK